MIRWMAAWVLLGGVLASVPAAHAAPQDDDDANGYAAILDNVDLLITNYGRFLSRKYDLTPEQEEYTLQMLREKSHSFLDKHDGELRKLVGRLFEVRAGGAMAPDELIAWGKKAEPLYHEAKGIVLDGNHEWRGILTDEQKKIHDEDLKLMEQSFEMTEEQLGRIVDGTMTVDEFRNPRRTSRTPSRSKNVQRSIPTNPGGGAPSVPPPVQQRNVPSQPPGDGAGATPPLPEDMDLTPEDLELIAQAEAEAAAESPGGSVVQPPGQPSKARVQPPKSPAGRRVGGSRDLKGWEARWDQYVKDFIARYELNDAQTQKADLILKDCKSRASQYEASHKTEMEQLEQQTQALNTSTDKDKAKKLAQLNERRERLAAPIDTIFEKVLKPRLDKIPTRAQRKAAESKAPAQKTREAAKKAAPEAAKDEPPESQPESGEPPESTDPD